MKKSHQQFLELLRSSLWEDKVEIQIEEIINWGDIYLLAQIHKCIPMIYGTSKRIASFNTIDKRLKSEWQSISNTTAFAQIHKRDKFLQLYKNLIENNIETLVFKGMIISQLYPSYEKRNYMTEDILIKKEDIYKVEELLLGNNFERKIAKEDRDGIQSYYCSDSALYLQVHTHLFEEEHNKKDVLEILFKDPYKDVESVNINGINVNTFSVDKHFIYIIYNAIRDYMNKTIRIRQIADITMFIHNNYDKLDWCYTWKFFEDLGYKDLVFTFIQIGVDYLNLDKSKILYYKEEKNLAYINIEELVSEILDGGFYGEKLFNYIDNMKEKLPDEYHNSKNESKLSNLKEKYEYLDKYPFLIPIALIKDILL